LLTLTGFTLPHLNRRLVALVAVVTAVSQLGCGGGVTTPDRGIPAHIDRVGDEQTGPAGGTLSIVVRVTDGQDRPVANQNVVFAPATGSGSVDPASARTDANGRASTAWTLGPAAGSQELVARAEGGNAPDGLNVSIGATAISGAPAAIEIAGGDKQTGPVGSALADSLVARVIDAGGNPVAGIEVHWSVSVTSGGSISPETVVTDAQGLAAAERVLGANAGPQSAQATVPDLTGSPLTFIHTAEAANPNRLLKVSGDGQSAPAGFQLADSLMVRLVDQNDNGVGGRSVLWLVESDEGSVVPVTSVTSPQGYAVTRWTMPSATGDYTIDAVFSGVDPVSFTGHATADVPTKLEMVSGNGQSASVGGQLPAPLRVKVTDANGNPVENVGVTWTAVNGAGSVSATSTGTDALGIAEVSRTLGLVPGPYTTTATVDGLTGSPVTFTSSATVGAAAKLAIVTQPAPTGLSGVPLETQPVIQLQDAFGNNVAQAGRAITAGVSGGSVTGGTASTDASGKATFSALAIVGASGDYQVTFSSGLLVPVTSDQVTLGAGDAAKLGFIVTPSVTVQAGVPWIQQPKIQLLDAGGNPVTTNRVNVAANVQVGGDTLGGDKDVLTVNGVATFSDLSVEGDVGPRTIRFRIPSVSGSAITFNLTVVAGPASQITAASDQSQTGTAGQAVAEPPSVLVRDKFGDPVSGVPVTFAITAGTGSISPTTAVTTGTDGTATLDSWTLGSGTNTVTATASGLSGSPVTFNATAGAVGTTTSVSDGAPNPSVAGQSVDFTATVVASGGGTPTGNVVFSVDGSNKPAQALNGSGQATLTVAFSNAGPHTVGAAYSGGGIFAASSDPTPASQTVNQAATSVALTSDHDGQTPPQGEQITFTATVSVTGPGSGTPTGQVLFFDGLTQIGSVAVSGGVASFSTTDLAEGGHSISAQYVGDANFALSTSSAVAQSVGAPADSGPIGMGESYNTNEDTPLTTDPGGGVLANDSDPDGDPITAVLVSPPQHSSNFSLNQNGSFSYQPTANYDGADAFTYRVSANGKTSGVLTASITVGPVNDPPVATGDDAGSSLLGTIVTQAPPGVLSNDTDVDSATLTAVLDQDVSHGALTLNPDGSFSYTPEPGYTGPDSFTYHAFDGSASSNTVTVTFLVVLSI
jgi:hypothetical protein